MAPGTHRDLRASKRLAWALRHGVAELGLSPDPAGWIPVPELLRALAENGTALDDAELQRIVAADAKGRYELDGGRVRARYGHSYQVEPGRPQAPPARLHHGTSTSALQSVLREGLRPMGRAFVHLTETPAQALAVGARHGSPVVLVVDAAGAAADDIAFWSVGRGTWLAREVPARYLAADRQRGSGSALP